MTHPNVLALAEQLAHLMPTPDRHALASDGASAVEAALKIAVQYWHNIGRPEKKGLIGMDQAIMVILWRIRRWICRGFHNPIARLSPLPLNSLFLYLPKTTPTGFSESRGHRGPC